MMTNERTSAVQTALNIPELLELILQGLPSVDLLLAQRTCRLWHSLIASSPQLQRQLFMRASWNFEGRRDDPLNAINRPGDRPINNLMPRSVLGGLYPRMTLKYIAPTAEGPNQVSEHEQRCLGHWAWDVCVSVPADKIVSSPTTSPAIQYESASWRRMFLSQPPATSLHLCRRWQRSPSPALECQEGIRMGQVMARAAQAEEAWSKLFLGSDRDWHLEGPINFSHFASDDAHLSRKRIVGI